MNLFVRVAFLLLSVSTISAPPRTPVDKILAIIYYYEEGSKQGSKLILQSDLRPDLTDTVPTLKDVIMKELILLDAKRLKIPVTDAEVDRHMARVQEQLGRTRSEMIDFFKDRGYTFEAARKELEKNLIIEITIEQRVKSKAYVSKSELEKYHKDNPAVLYQIKQAFIPFEGTAKATKRDAVDRAIANGTVLKVIDWVGPIEMTEADFSSDKAFVKELVPGTVAKVNETDEGISLMHLISKRVVPFEERKQEINNILGREKYMKALDEYYDSLLSEKQESRVRYIDTKPS